MPPQTRRELWLGLYVGFVWNLGVGAILNNPLQSSTRTWFVTFGAANELIGVLMIASPELLPILANAVGRFAGFLRRMGARLVERARRFLHLPKVVRVGLADTLNIGGSIDTRVTRKRPETLDEAVDMLLRHDAELHEHQKQLNRFPAQWQADIEEAQHQAEGFTREEVKRLADRRLALRLLGLGFVVLGLLLSTVGNLV
jgi:hypothetical protein